MSAPHAAWSPDPRWDAGPRVRVDTLRHGDRFLDSDGHEWVYDRAHSSCGVHCVDGERGATLFAGCAEVVLVGGAS